MALTFIITLMMGVPIYAAIGTSTVIPLLIFNDFSPTLVAQTMFSGIDNFVLIAIALFIISGSLMQKTGMTDEILEIADAAVGHVPGGIGVTTIVASAFFAALAGSGLAATVAIGSITVAGMVRRNYGEALAGAVAASGGALGVLIPPSNPMIIYGVVSGTSIGKLFMAGFLPGILVASSLAFVMYFIGKKKNLVGTEQKFSWERLLKAIWKGKWGLLAPIIILGSIYSGIATPTEAAEIAVLYALLYGLVIRRNVDLETLVVAFRDGAINASVMLAMGGVANGFGQLVTIYQIPQRVGAFIGSITDVPELVLLMIVGLLFITGMFMETISQIIILTPILLPVLTGLGVDPVVFGIIFVLLIEIGFLTPPVGGNLFAATKLCKATLLEIAWAEVPFILTYLGWALIFIFFPQIITFLPNLLAR